jgi:glyoxylate reductase
MAKVFICRNWFPEELQRVAQVHETKIWMEENNPPRRVLLEAVREIDGLICLGSDDIDAEVIRAARRLKIISSFSTGVNNIDVGAATARKIPVVHPPHVLTETTADLAFALILAAARRIVEGEALVRQGRWKNSSHLDLPGVDVNHARLGVIGLGRIGAQVAKRGKAFNMQVSYYSRSRKFDLENLLGLEYVPDLHPFLGQADFIVICASLNEKNRHLIGRAEFAVMKPTAILVNASRGALIDSRALYEALKSGKILRAAIDVTEIEPIPPEDPLLTLDNLIIMPHIGSAVPQTRRKMMAMAVDHLLMALEGKRVPLCLNPEVYDESRIGKGSG